ncbi:MAG: hypothetical protein GY720_02010, partial [bacterium]|nr:hypothetical protein [bacterium]
IQLDDSFMVEAPFFPFQEELLGAEEMSVDGNWGVRYLFGAGTLDNLETVMDVISQAAADPDNFAGTLVDTSEPFMNHGANGSPSLILPDLPYHPDAVAAGLGGEDFILYGIGCMRIEEAGTYTIGVHSDDGFAFRVHGWTFTESFGGDGRDPRNGTIDPGSPDTIIHPSVTGDSNTRAVAANVQPGIYRIEFCWWERASGDHGEIYIAKGRFPNDGDTTEWLPIGSQEPGGIQLVTKEETVRITEINFNSATSELNISWESDLGFLYNIRGDSEPADAGDPRTWGVILENIEATPPINTRVIPINPGANPLSFFVVERFPKPPVTILAENFDDAAALPAGWVASTDGSGTVWEVGTPPGGGVGGGTAAPSAASSPLYCAGTNILGYYTENANVTLTSPSIYIPAGSGATLNFKQWIDTDLGLGSTPTPRDVGSVHILDADNSDTPIAGLEILDIEGNGSA